MRTGLHPDMHNAPFCARRWLDTPTAEAYTTEAADNPPPLPRSTTAAHRHRCEQAATFRTARGTTSLLYTSTQLEPPEAALRLSGQNSRTRTAHTQSGEASPWPRPSHPHADTLGDRPHRLQRGEA